MEVHVVSKTDNAGHATFNLQTESSPTVQLAPSSIRVRTLFLSLTSNNLSYAQGGHFLHWDLAILNSKIGWDTYPLPTASPARYNDVASWGIVPAWGYALVIESTTSIAKGTVVWGFWPTSTLPADLQLKAIEPEGHWIEITENGQKLMNTYNRYMEVPRSPDSVSSPDFGEDESSIWRGTLCSAVSGKAPTFSVNSVFSPSPQTQTPIHPLGMGMSWTATDTDLASAVVVRLSASFKTARSFAYHLSQRPAARPRLGLFEITSLPSPISKAAESLDQLFPIKTVDYTNVPESMDWMAGLKASNIVIADFGARANSLGQLLELIKKHAAMHSLKVVIIQVGSQQKVRTRGSSATDFRKAIDHLYETGLHRRRKQLAAKEEMSKLDKVQYNTSGVQDAVMQVDGAEAYSYFDKLTHVWDECYRTRHASIPDMRIVWGEG